MVTFDVINFGITIGLGVLSLGISCFAIWLSLRFQDKSDSALDSIKALSHQIQQNVEVSLTHQKDFSSKMLDSLIEQNQYGIPGTDTFSRPENIEQTVHTRLDNIEERVFEKLEGEVSKLNGKAGIDAKHFENIAESLRSEIRSIKDTAQEASSEAILPIALKERLESFRDYPAHFVVLAGLIKSRAHSFEDLEKAQKKYHFPDSFDSGLENLMQADLILGDFDSFQVNPDFEPYLTNWVDKNWSLIRQLMKHYSQKEDSVVSDFEVALADRLRFDLTTGRSH